MDAADAMWRVVLLLRWLKKNVNKGLASQNFVKMNLKQMRTII